MVVIDAQVHVYERDHAGRPWIRPLPGPPEVTGDNLVAEMDALGIDGALLVSPYTLYGFDPSYAVEVRASYPDRFAVITPIDPHRDDAAEVVAEWAAAPGAVGIRIMTPEPEVNEKADVSIEDPGVNRVMLAAARHSLPVCLSCWDQLSLVDEIAAKYPDTQLVIDHLGLRQPLVLPKPAEPFADLAVLLALARYPNVAVKVTGTATVSHEPFPFRDLRGPLGRVFEAFGFDRCMWGTDWTRATEMVSYLDAVAAFRDTDWLSAPEREALMGGTLQRIFGWAPAPLTGSSKQ